MKNSNDYKRPVELIHDLLLRSKYRSAITAIEHTFGERYCEECDEKIANDYSGFLVEYSWWLHDTRNPMAAEHMRAVLTILDLHLEGEYGWFVPAVVDDMELPDYSEGKHGTLTKNP